MPEQSGTSTPFRFYTRLSLSELTGLRATSIGELLELIKTVPGSCIYHHTHRFLQRHQYLSPEPPNDFAYWVSSFLNEVELGEKLASVNVVEFPTIRSLREEFIKIIEKHLKENPEANNRSTRNRFEFHFIKSISFIFPTHYVAYNLQQLSGILKKITIDSIYFHVFEARLRLEKGGNDFSFWIDTSLNNKELAQKISKLDPYTYTLEDLRNTLVKLIEKNITT